MQKIILTLAATVGIAAVPVLAQETGPAPIQANPVGSDLPPTATPPDPQTANTPVQPAIPADPNYHAGPYAGALTPPPPEAMNKSYPVCSKTITDSCINPSDARKAGMMAKAHSRKRTRVANSH
jgi:hypothetical protein